MAVALPERRNADAFGLIMLVTVTKSVCVSRNGIYFFPGTYCHTSYGTSDGDSRPRIQ